VPMIIKPSEHCLTIWKNSELFEYTYRFCQASRIVRGILYWF
jgi:hypothetical protein